MYVHSWIIRKCMMAHGRIYILACQVYERTVGGIAMPGIKTKVYLDIFLFSVTCMHNTRSYRAGDFCSTLWFNFHEDQFQLSSACMLTAVLINFATQVRLWFMLLHHVATNCNEKSSTYSGCSSKVSQKATNVRLQKWSADSTRNFWWERKGTYAE